MPHDTIAAEGLFVREMKPARTPKGAFLLLHGMESHSAWFLPFAARLVGENYAVIAYDCPGWGRSPGARGHLGSYHDFVESAVRIAAQIRAKYGSVHLGGMSWGGMAALYLGLRRGWMFDSLTLLAPGLASRIDLPFLDKVRLARDFIRKNPAGLLAPVFRPEHFTADPDMQRFIKDDPDRVLRVTSSFCLETLKMRRFIAQHAGKRQTPAGLCLLAGKDAVVDNSAVAALCRKAGFGVETLPDAAHTLIFERPEQVADIMLRHAGTVRDFQAKPTGKVWVVGAGAVGGSMASLLSFGGVRTGVLVKPNYLETLRRDGFTLRSGLARRTSDSGLVFGTDPAELPGPPDLVVTAVKSFDTEQALRPLTDWVTESTVIASLQNGVGNEDRIARLFPNNTIVAGSICAGLELEGLGRSNLADDRGGLGAALHKGNLETARTVWQNLMTQTGMECRWFDGINAAGRLKWSKLMLNIAFNALNSVTGLSSSAILADGKYGELALRALAEGFAVMDRLELHPVDLPGFPVSKMRLLLKVPGTIPRRVMAWQAGRSEEVPFSMRQDFLNKRQHTEIDELNGVVVAVGRRYGLSTLANQKLVEMVKKYQSGS